MGKHNTSISGPVCTLSTLPEDYDVRLMLHGQHHFEPLIPFQTDTWHELF